MKKLFFLLLVLAVSAVRLLAQETATAQLTSELDSYRAKHIQEKIFVHTDKEFYLAGRSAGLNCTWSTPICTSRWT